MIISVCEWGFEAGHPKSRSARGALYFPVLPTRSSRVHTFFLRHLSSEYIFCWNPRKPEVYLYPHLTPSSARRFLNDGQLLVYPSVRRSTQTCAPMKKGLGTTPNPTHELTSYLRSSGTWIIPNSASFWGESSGPPLFLRFCSSRRFPVRLLWRNQVWPCLALFRHVPADNDWSHENTDGAENTWDER